MGSDAKPGIDVQSELERLSRRSERQQAISKIGEAGAAEAVGPLLRFCKEAKKEERVAVCQALAQIGAPAVGPLVEQGLGSETSRVRRCAVIALAEMGATARPAFERLLECLDDDSSGVRAQAVRALGKVGDPRAVQPLISLLDDADGDLRDQAAIALGDLGDVAAAAVCRVLESSESLRARVAAMEALVEIGGEVAESCLRRTVQDASALLGLRVVGLAALGQVMGEGVFPLAVAGLSKQEPELRRQAVRCLCQVNTAQATIHLMGLYQDEDKKVRKLALEGLQARYEELLDRIKAGKMETVPALLATWRSMGKKQAWEANAISQTLVRIGRPVVPALVDTLQEAPELPAADVVGVLEKMGTEAATAYDALALHLDSPDVATCCAAARALGCLGEERAIPPLAARLSFDNSLLQAKKHKDKRARKRALALQEAAAVGLGCLSKAALIPALEAARSEDPVARRGGMLTLGRIGGGRALAALDRGISDLDPMVREAAAEAMEHAAANDIRRLGRMLKNEDEQVRVKAVKALAKLYDLRSLDLLLRAYGDPSKRVSRAVVKALAQREGDRAQSILIAAAAGGNVSALRVLQRQPLRHSIPALVEALDSPWRQVYVAALKAVLAYVDAFGDDARAMSAIREVVPDLIYLLHDDSSKARQMALEALGAIQDPGTVPEISFLLMDDKRDIRRAAIRVLAAIGSEEAVVALRARCEESEEEDLRAEIAEVLAPFEGN